jgi:hypothetical protein
MARNARTVRQRWDAAFGVEARPEHARTWFECRRLASGYLDAASLCLGTLVSSTSGRRRNLLERSRLSAVSPTPNNIGSPVPLDPLELSLRRLQPVLPGP